MTQATPSTTDRIEDRLAAATADLDLASDRGELARAAERDSYDGADADEIDEALIGVLTARTERDPTHDDAAARIARWRHARSVTGTDGPLSGETYRASFMEAIESGVERVDFHAPIDLGDIAVLTAYVYDTGETSMQVRVDVTAERPSESVKRETASSHLTFVAIDGEESVQPVPDLAVETDEERRLRAAAMDAEEPPVP